MVDWSSLHKFYNKLKEEIRVPTMAESSIDMKEAEKKLDSLANQIVKRGLGSLATYSARYSRINLSSHNGIS